MLVNTGGIYDEVDIAILGELFWRVVYFDRG